MIDKTIWLGDEGRSMGEVLNVISFENIRLTVLFDQPKRSLECQASSNTS
jgi:hypothetical protein